MRKLDMKIIEPKLVRFIQDYVHGNGFKDVVIGMSGGLDSSVVAALCARALGKKRVFGVLLPYKTSSSESGLHAAEMCRLLNISHDTVNITPIVDAYFNNQTKATPLRIGNMCARIRMSVLYDYSVQFKALVAGTSNKSEYLLGYCTQFGDSAAAFEPIADLYKTQVFELAKYLGLPDFIINKKPTADLWQGQTDEDEIGASYKEIDEILSSIKNGLLMNAENWPKKTIRNILERVDNSQFKRELPPIAIIPE